MKFSVRTLAIFVLVASVFLAMNAVPWRTRHAIYVNDGTSYFPLVDRYGWPYAYLHKYVDSELPSDVAAWDVIDDNRLLQAYDNAIICLVLAVAVTVLIVFIIRRFNAAATTNATDSNLDTAAASR